MQKLCDKLECPLYDTKRVRYRGDTKDVSIVFVLESPDLFESKMGSLLVGGAGDVFWNEITRAGLGNHSAFVTTAAMCHIPKEEGLKIKEINSILNNCRTHLERAIKTLKPKLIVTMGALSSQQLIKMKTLGDKRGTFIWSEEFNCYVFPTYDPYFCTKKPSAASLFAADLRRVKTFLIGGEVVIEDREIIVERRESIADIIDSSKIIAVDTETQGLDYINPNGVMVSYSISNDSRKAYQVFLHEECKEEEADFSINWERGKGKARKWTKVFVRKCSNFETKVKELGELLGNENIKKVFMNVKYDLHHISSLFRNNGFGELKLGGPILDTRDLAHCLDENLYARATLEFLRKSFTTLNTQYSDEFDATFDKSDMLAIPQDDLTKYAASDACVTYNVAMGVIRALKQEPNYERILFYYKNMVMPVTNQALFEMEENGITTNMALLPSVKEELRKELDYLYMKIMASIPHSIKDRYIDKRTPEAPLTKTNMIRDMLYTKDGFNIKPLIDKKTKLPNTSIEKKTRTLLLATKLSNAAVDFLTTYDRWKMIDTLLSRYIKGIEKATRLDGKIHSSFSLSVAATGRSCLAENTHIRTKTENSNFLLKNIQDIKPGDVVFSYDTHWEKIINTKVKWAGKTGDKVETIDVIFSSKGGQAAGGHIRCTPEHLVYVKDRGYVPAIEVNPGDDLISSEADVYYCKVEKIIIDHKLVDVYDLTIDGPPNFIANGVCVHNSSQGPNLQNIPKRGPLAKVIRKLFVASPGYTFVSADASQCELRFLSLLSQDPVMLDVYRKGEDIHTKTGEAIVGKKKEEMTPEEFKDARQKAKCFHPDTEVLTKDGWIALKELSIDQEVMQAVPFDDNIILEWVLPTYLEIRKNHMDSLVHIHGRNIDIRVTPDHRMLIQRATKEFTVVEPKDFVKARYFWKAGEYNSNSSLIIDSRILKLAVATQADGSFQDNCIRFGFYKERKIKRLLSLLEEGEYSIALHKNGKNRPVTSINIKVPLATKIRLLLDKNKCFTWDVLNWSFEDRLIFIEELSYWDGCITAGGPEYVRYTSSIKLNCDVIQAVCALTGYSTKIIYDGYYQVSIQKKAKSRGDQSKSSKYSALKVEAEEHKGDVAVISVPSSFLLVRSKEGEKRQATIIIGQSANFGFIYGSGALTFQRVAKTDYGVELTEKEAQEFKDTFFNTYPTIHKYHYKVKAECHKDNGVMSPLGRFRHLPEMALDTKANEKNKEIQSIIHSAERQALNHAIQSVSSDAVLLSCLEIMKVVDPEECRPILFIHDELTFEVISSKVDKYAAIIKHHMVNPPLAQFGVELNLPLGSDCKAGSSLDDMHDWNPPEDL